MLRSYETFRGKGFRKDGEGNAFRKSFIPEVLKKKSFRIKAYIQIENINKKKHQSER